MGLNAKLEAMVWSANLDSGLASSTGSTNVTATSDGISISVSDDERLFTAMRNCLYEIDPADDWAQE